MELLVIYTASDMCCHIQEKTGNVLHLGVAENKKEALKEKDA